MIWGCMGFIGWLVLGLFVVVFVGFWGFVCFKWDKIPSDFCTYSHQHGGSSVLCYNYLTRQRFWFSLSHWKTTVQSKDRSLCSWVQEACVYDPTQSFKTQDPSNPVTELSEHLGRTSSDIQPCLRVFQVRKWAVVPRLCSSKLTLNPEVKCFLLSPLRACRTWCSWSMFTEDLSDGLCTKQTRATPPTPE